uniref:MULE transposase domain-containing protein n=1 Tax=Lactuca sativa TaxID=4236 RepID=A0A9R1UQV0_LACSA|nr:hypothetical protein LSAT_V11C800417250 [Lactuca sativa]
MMRNTTQPLGMPEPLPLLKLAQQNRNGATKHNYNSHMKLYQLFKKKEALKLNLGLKSVRAFQICLHPIIIIDGAHLKRKYLGTMFLAIGMDGNKQILTIAFGVGKTESGE